MFSRLESRYGLSGSCVLDLFAGTGALGIESLSRAAGSAVFVESNAKARSVLERNVNGLGLDGVSEVVARDFRAALADLEGAGRVFDGVFVDAPYGLGLDEEALLALGSGALLRPAAWVSVETARASSLPPCFEVLTLVREDSYGDTKLLLYEAGEQGESSR